MLRIIIYRYGYSFWNSLWNGYRCYGLGESRGAKENFELFRGWKLKRRGSYRRGGVFIWVDKSNNLYPLWNEKRREEWERERKGNTYRIIVATAISTILNNTFLQWSCFLSNGWLLAPQWPAHLQQQKNKPTHGRIAARRSPTKVKPANPP